MNRSLESYEAAVECVHELAECRGINADLLAALDDLINHCIGLMVNSPGECDPEKDDTIIKMRVVIAKATGEKL